MIADIRGGLGTQVLELMGYFALAIERGTPITAIRINCGGWISDDGVRNSLADYISEIFPRLSVSDVKITNGAGKLGVFKDHALLGLILKHRIQILRLLGPMRTQMQGFLPVLHVRRGDYEWVPLGTYIAYGSAHQCALIGNVPADTAMVPGIDISAGPVHDWMAAHAAPEVIGTASTFLISLLFMDPEKRLSLFANQTGAVYEEIMAPMLKRFADKFPNLRWVQ